MLKKKPRSVDTISSIKSLLHNLCLYMMSRGAYKKSRDACAYIRSRDAYAYMKRPSTIADKISKSLAFLLLSGLVVLASCSSGGGGSSGGGPTNVVSRSSTEIELTAAELRRLLTTSELSIATIPINLNEARRLVAPQLGVAQADVSSLEFYSNFTVEVELMGDSTSPAKNFYSVDFDPIDRQGDYAFINLSARLSSALQGTQMTVAELLARGSRLSIAMRIRALRGGVTLGTTTNTFEIVLMARSANSVDWNNALAFNQNSFAPDTTSFNQRAILAENNRFGDTFTLARGNLLSAFGLSISPNRVGPLFFGLNDIPQSGTTYCQDMVYVDNEVLQIRAKKPFDYDDPALTNAISFVCHLSVSDTATGGSSIGLQLSDPSRFTRLSGAVLATSAAPGCTSSNHCYLAAINIEITNINENPTIVLIGGGTAFGGMNEGTGPSAPYLATTGYDTAGVQATSLPAIDNDATVVEIYDAEIVGRGSSNARRAGIFRGLAEIVAVSPAHFNDFGHLFELRYDDPDPQVANDPEGNWSLAVHTPSLDYERFSPSELTADGKAIYKITIEARDGSGGVTRETFDFEVKDVLYAPVFVDPQDTATSPVPLAAGSAAFVRADNIINSTGMIGGAPAEQLSVPSGAQFLTSGLHRLGSVAAVNPETGTDAGLVYSVESAIATGGSNDAATRIGNSLAARSLQGRGASLIINGAEMNDSDNAYVRLSASYQVLPATARSNVANSTEQFILQVNDAAYISANTPGVVDRSRLPLTFTDRTINASVRERTAPDSVRFGTQTVLSSRISTPAGTSPSFGFVPQNLLRALPAFTEFAQLGGPQINQAEQSFLMTATDGAIEFRGSDSDLKFEDVSADNPYLLFLVYLGNSTVPQLQDPLTADLFDVADLAFVRLNILDENEDPTLSGYSPGLDSQNRLTFNVEAGVLFGSDRPVLARFRVNDDNDKQASDFTGVLTDNAGSSSAGDFSVTFVDLPGGGVEGQLRLNNPIPTEALQGKSFNPQGKSIRQLADGSRLFLDANLVVSDSGQYRFDQASGISSAIVPTQARGNSQLLPLRAVVPAPLTHAPTFKFFNPSGPSLDSINLAYADSSIQNGAVIFGAYPQGQDSALVRYTRYILEGGAADASSFKLNIANPGVLDFPTQDSYPASAEVTLCADDISTRVGSAGQPITCTAQADNFVVPRSFYSFELQGPLANMLEVGDIYSFSPPNATNAKTFHDQLSINIKVRDAAALRSLNPGTYSGNQLVSFVTGEPAIRNTFALPDIKIDRRPDVLRPDYTLSINEAQVAGRSSYNFPASAFSLDVRDFDYLLDPANSVGLGKLADFTIRVENQRAANNGAFVPRLEEYDFLAVNEQNGIWTLSLTETDFIEQRLFGDLYADLVINITGEMEKSRPVRLAVSQAAGKEVAYDSATKPSSGVIPSYTVDYTQSAYDDTALIPVAQVGNRPLVDSSLLTDAQSAPSGSLINITDGSQNDPASTVYSTLEVVRTDGQNAGFIPRNITDLGNLTNIFNTAIKTDSESRLQFIEIPFQMSGPISRVDVLVEDGNGKLQPANNEFSRYFEDIERVDASLNTLGVPVLRIKQRTLQFADGIGEYLALDTVPVFARNANKNRQTLTYYLRAFSETGNVGNAASYAMAKVSVVVNAFGSNRSRPGPTFTLADSAGVALTSGSVINLEIDEGASGSGTLYLLNGTTSRHSPVRFRLTKTGVMAGEYSLFIRPEPGAPTNVLAWSGVFQGSAPTITYPISNPPTAQQDAAVDTHTYFWEFKSSNAATPDDALSGLINLVINEIDDTPTNLDLSFTDSRGVTTINKRSNPNQELGLRVAYEYKDQDFRQLSPRIDTNYVSSPLMAVFRNPTVSGVASRADEQCAIGGSGTSAVLLDNATFANSYTTSYSRTATDSSASIAGLVRRADTAGGLRNLRVSDILDSACSPSIGARLLSINGTTSGLTIGVKRTFNDGRVDLRQEGSASSLTLGATTVPAYVVQGYRNQSVAVSVQSTAITLMSATVGDDGRIDGWTPFGFNVTVTDNDPDDGYPTMPNLGNNADILRPNDGVAAVWQNPTIVPKASNNDVCNFVTVQLVGSSYQDPQPTTTANQLTAQFPVRITATTAVRSDPNQRCEFTISASEDGQSDSADITISFQTRTSPSPAPGNFLWVSVQRVLDLLKNALVGAKIEEVNITLPVPTFDATDPNADTSWLLPQFYSSVSGDVPDFLGLHSLVPAPDAGLDGVRAYFMLNRQPNAEELETRAYPDVVLDLFDSTTGQILTAAHIDLTLVDAFAPEFTEFNMTLSIDGSANQQLGLDINGLLDPTAFAEPLSAVTLASATASNLEVILASGNNGDEYTCSLTATSAVNLAVHTLTLDASAETLSGNAVALTRVSDGSGFGLGDLATAESSTGDTQDCLAPSSGTQVRGINLRDLRLNFTTANGASVSTRAQNLRVPAK